MPPMILVDVNLLVYAVFTDSPHHGAARQWLEATFNGPETIALPWAVLVGFIRISTNPRVMSCPLTIEKAISYVDEWLMLPNTVAVGPTRAHQDELAKILRASGATGNLVSDAHLAALAAEYDCVLASTDNDFQKFPGLRWFNPLSAPASVL